MLKKVKITVLHLGHNRELGKTYRKEIPPICSIFSEGQDFIVDSFQKPSDFCDWAWMDIQRIVFAFLFDGNLGHFSPNPKEFIACCTDAFRPVSFKIEKMD